MIGVIFSKAGEHIEVRLNDSSVYFRTSPLSGWAELENLKIDHAGVLKEFPDLESDEDWKKKAIGRFKEKVKSMENENQRMKYIIDDLAKYGYVAEVMQRQGSRPIKLKHGK